MPGGQGVAADADAGAEAGRRCLSPAAARGSPAAGSAHRRDAAAQPARTPLSARAASPRCRLQTASLIFGHLAGESVSDPRRRAQCLVGLAPREPGPVPATVSGVSRKRRGRARRHRHVEFGPALPWHERGPADDDEIAAFDDDRDAIRLTIAVELVVRVTRPQVLQRFAAETQAATAQSIGPDGFGPLAYLAVCQEGLDEIADGPAGQLRYLASPGCVISGIPGVAAEAATMTITATPPEVTAALREDRSGDVGEASRERDTDPGQDEAAVAAEDEPPF